MKTCPHCGHDNPDEATSCGQCNEPLPPVDGAPTSAVPGGVPTSPPPDRDASAHVASPRPSFWTPQRLYLVGIGLGLIPLTLWLIAWSAGVSLAIIPTSATSRPGQGLSTAAVSLYFIQLVAGVVCLVSRRARHVGYGLLTMVLVDPIVGTIGCIVIVTRPR